MWGFLGTALSLTTQTSHPCSFQKSQFLALCMILEEHWWMHVVPWCTLSCQASQEFTHNRFMWEKPELFSVSGVKGRLCDECHTTEECFIVCTARVRRRKHGRVSLGVRRRFLFSVSAVLVFQNICGHFDFTATSLPPPPHFSKCTCRFMTRGKLTLSWTLIIFMFETCHKHRVRKRCTFHPGFDHTEHNCYFHLSLYWCSQHTCQWPSP